MILFFYPSSVNVEEQIMQVSLCEGLIDFSKNLTKENIKVVGMNERKYIFYEVEEEIWFILVIKAEIDQGTV